MLNRIVIVGRLTRDPELRRTTSDMPVASFTIAVDDTQKDANGNKITSFIGVSVFNAQADNVAKYCRKGSLVGVDGKLRQRTFERRDGTKSSVIEIIADRVEFLEPKGTREVQNEEVIFDDVAPEDEGSKNLDAIDVTDEDLPF